MYACTHSGSSVSDMTQSIDAYDTATGHLTSVLRTWHAKDLSCAITADPAGGHLLLATTGGKTIGSATPKNSVSNGTGNRTLLHDGHPSTILTWIDLSDGAATTLPIRVPIGTGVAL
jgi:hypothetical protein